MAFNYIYAAIITILIWEWVNAFRKHLKREKELRWVEARKHLQSFLNTLVYEKFNKEIEKAVYNFYTYGTSYLFTEETPQKESVFTAKKYDEMVEKYGPLKFKIPKNLPPLDFEPGQVLIYQTPPPLRVYDEITPSNWKSVRTKWPKITTDPEGT